MIEHIEHHIVNHCNLNCAYCNHFSPLCEPWIESVEEFEEEFQALKENGIKIELIRILGGEPLLNPNLGEILKITRKLFPTSQIELISNAILLEKQKDILAPICNENNIRLVLSYYHLNLDLKTLAKDFKSKYCYDKNKFSNLSLNTKGIYDGARMFAQCPTGSQWKCRFYKNKRLYVCPMAANLPFLTNYFHLKNEEIGQLTPEELSIDITTHTPEEIERFLNTPCKLCNHCNVPRALEGVQWRHSLKEKSEWIEN